MGDMAVLDRPTVALVGARNASSLGTRMARSLAAELSEQGYTVVSDLARGVDTAALLASLKGGTVAVMADGVDVIYPAKTPPLPLISTRPACASGNSPSASSPRPATSPAATA
ncbi:DNA recombination-mediator protein A [Roseovarius tolerans]|uniref:DNA recombination-mediator protein A n=1 Tax=Roseovarius tolerans TaxID=74031 RepID=A0A1H8GF44_9RHOB|nr:DNA recombination-mediator protein A [Roseovarius tolerans]